MTSCDVKSWKVVEARDSFPKDSEATRTHKMESAGKLRLSGAQS